MARKKELNLIIKLLTDQTQLIAGLNKAKGTAKKKGKGAGKAYADGFKSKIKKNLAKSIGSFLGNVGANIASSAFNLLKGALRGAFKEAKNFSKEFANINTLLSKTKRITHETRRAFQGLASEYGASRTKQARSYYDIVSSGVMDVDRRMRILTQANKAAIAGVTDVRVATRALVGVMNAYADSNLTVEKASDQMFLAVKRGLTTFPELAESIGRVAPMANAANLSFGELTGTLGFLTKKGIKTDEAVTGMRGILRAMIKPAEDSAKVMEHLGIRMGVQEIKALGLVGVLEKVREATGGNAEVLGMLFPRVQALTAMLPIMGEGWEDYVKIINEAKGATEETSKAYSAFDRNLSKSTDEMVESWGNFGGAAMAALEGPLIIAIDLIKVMGQLGEAIAELPTSDNIPENTGMDMASGKTVIWFGRTVRETLRDDVIWPMQEAAKAAGELSDKFMEEFGGGELPGLKVGFGLLGRPKGQEDKEPDGRSAKKTKAAMAHEAELQASLKRMQAHYKTAGLNEVETARATAEEKIGILNELLAIQKDNLGREIINILEANELKKQIKNELAEIEEAAKFELDTLEMEEHAQKLLDMEFDGEHLAAALLQEIADIRNAMKERIIIEKNGLAMIRKLKAKHGKAVEESTKVQIQIGREAASVGIDIAIDAFERLGAQMMRGGDQWTHFWSKMVETMGSAMVMIGKTLILAGIGMAATKMLEPATAIIAGAALVAIGAIMSGAAGGGPEENMGAAETSRTSAGTTIESKELTEEEIEREEIRPSITLNVHGDVLDSEETGMKLISLLNETFETKGAVTTEGIIA